MQYDVNIMRFRVRSRDGATPPPNPDGSLPVVNIARDTLGDAGSGTVLDAVIAERRN
jgi:hypothetical protein